MTRHDTAIVKLIKAIAVLGKCIEAQGATIEGLVDIVKLAAKSDPLDFNRFDILETKVAAYLESNARIVKDSKELIAPLVVIMNEENPNA